MPNRGLEFGVRGSKGYEAADPQLHALADFIAPRHPVSRPALPAKTAARAARL
ncbi:hypothetical protein [Streptomyces sp. NPDC059446]|uniref:hypothetical protein n=1 Tax=Streptomyces sp. NPDC059446 TaxID=3346833 RepID=UPI003685F06F